VHILAAAHSSLLNVIAARIHKISFRRDQSLNCPLCMLTRLVLLYYCIIALGIDILTWMIIIFEMFTYICLISALSSIHLLRFYLTKRVKSVYSLSIWRISLIKALLNSWWNASPKWLWVQSCVFSAIDAFNARCASGVCRLVFPKILLNCRLFQLIVGVNYCGRGNSLGLGGSFPIIQFIRIWAFKLRTLRMEIL